MAPPSSPHAPLWAECRAILANAWPVGIAYAVGYAGNLMSASIVGHLGADALAAAALGTMFANASGYAVLYGTASAIDTLASQAYGAGNLARVGAILQRGTLVLLSLAVPTAALWLTCGPILVACGQHPELAEQSARYIRWLMLGMPAVMAYEAHKKTLQAVNDMRPPLVVAGIATAVNGCLGTYLVHSTPLGLMGAALANSVAQWTMLGCMLAYFRWHRLLRSAAAGARDVLTCRRCRRGSGGGGSASVATAWSTSAATAVPTEVPASSAATATVESVSAVESPAPRARAPAADASGGEADEREEAGLLKKPAAAGSSKPPAAAAADAAASATVGSGTPGTAAASVTALQPTAVPPADGDAVDMDAVLDAIAVPWDAKFALSGWREFLALGAPSAAMLVAEWSSYEVASLVAGIYGTSTLAAHNIVATTAGLLYMVVLGVTVSGSLRVGQRMGEGSAEGAKLVYRAILVCTAGVMAFNAGFTLAVRNVWARVFTDDADVVGLVSAWMPLLALYAIFDAGQGTSGGVLKGVGRPALAAATNVVAYCVISLPLCQLLCNVKGWGLPGIWTGFCCGVAASTCFLTLMLGRLDWQREADTARARAMRVEGGDSGSSEGGAPAVGDDDDDEKAPMTATATATAAVSPGADAGAQAGQDVERGPPARPPATPQQQQQQPALAPAAASRTSGAAKQPPKRVRQDHNAGGGKVKGAAA